jgi:hypothetical protein
MLTPKERGRILAMFRALRRLPEDRWEAKGVRRAGPESPVYRFNPTRSLVVFFTPEGEGRFLLEDIMSAEVVEQITCSLQESPPRP